MEAYVLKKAKSRINSAFYQNIPFKIFIYHREKTLQGKEKFNRVFLTAEKVEKRGKTMDQI